MAEYMNMHLVTPERELFSSQVSSVILPGLVGETEILPGHAHLLIELCPGVVKSMNADKAFDYFAISGGYAEIQNDIISILAETAEHASEIDKERALHAMEIAQTAMNGKGPEDEEYRREKKHFERAATRLRVTTLKN